MAFVITGNAWAEDFENLTFQNCCIKDGQSCIKSVSGNLTISSCTFENNYNFNKDSNLDGSAINISGGKANISNSKFKFHPYSLRKDSVLLKNINGTVYIDNKAQVSVNSCTYDGNPKPYKDFLYEEEYKNQMHSATFMHVKGNSQVSFSGENYFMNCTNSCIYSEGTGELNFEVNSTTSFQNNASAFGMMKKVTIEKNAKVKTQSYFGTNEMVLNGNLEIGDYLDPSLRPTTISSSIIGILKSDAKGTLTFVDKAFLAVETNYCKDSQLTLLASAEANAAVNGDANLLVSKIDWCEDTRIVMDETKDGVIGEITAELGENPDTGCLMVKKKYEKTNTKNQAITDNGVALKLHWRSHLSDMNKRMGELRDAHGELGVWTRMVRGENEYKGTKAQYNQYQLGYDEKLSVDKRWTVGTAITFAEGDASYGYGTTDDKSTAFTIYGSKLNNDGSYVDLIARYEHLESKLDDVNSGKGDYGTNGFSMGAEVGKRFKQNDGAWIEPQVQLTYGTVDSAEFVIGGKNVQVGDMDSLIGRIGFRIGQDIEQGNVYARASYLYDFDGKTEATFSKGTDSRTIKEDLGGGWWEVGVGTNINLSKATYLYAEVDKTFGGEVDTNWQWNLGVRYSF